MLGIELPLIALRKSALLILGICEGDRRLLCTAFGLCNDIANAILRDDSVAWAYMTIKESTDIIGIGLMRKIADANSKATGRWEAHGSACFLTVMDRLSGSD